jgi:hypothetical protein
MQRLKGNRRSIEGGDRVYMQRGQDIILTPRGEKQMTVLFSTIMLLQFSVSETGEGVFVLPEPFGSPDICWRGVQPNGDRIPRQANFRISMREFCHLITKIDLVEWAIAAHGMYESSQV